MSPLSLNQVLPYIAWLIALVELILGFYVLVLNAWHTANRHTSALLLIVATNSFAIGSMINALTLQNASMPAVILAATTTAIEPLLLLSTIALLKPEWLTGKWRWIWWPFYTLVVVPTILIVLDRYLRTNLWYTGIDPNSYSGGFLILDVFTQGRLSSILQLINYAALTFITIILLVYFANFNRKATKKNKKLAWMLLSITLLAGFIRAFIANLFDPALATLTTSTIFALSYSYACFSQMVSERRMQRGSFQLRLTALILAVTVPLMITITVFVTTRAGQLIEQFTLGQLRNTNQVLATRMNSWQDNQAKALQALVRQPDIISMDPERQMPVIQSMATVYPHLALISISDPAGNNIARSDQKEGRNYSQLTWFQNAGASNSPAFETLIDGVTGKPIVVVSAPIRDNRGEILGVGMLSTSLDDIDKLIRNNQLGKGGLALVLNEKNQIIASSDPSIVTDFQGTDLYLSLSTARQAMEGRSNAADAHYYSNNHTYRDLQGTSWRANSTMLANGWAVVVQIPETALMASLRNFQRASWLALIAGSLSLLVLSWLTIRQAIQPVRTLTETATSIANGDLTRVAMVETDDEIGLLARTFNSMTGQLRELIANLERRVTDRTRDLERRAIQLQVAADVSREASAFQDLEQLLDHTVQLISKRFSFYHAGIFLIDDARKFAILRAASSEGGQQMLTRGHLLEVGKIGIVGFVAGSGKPRIALDVGADAVFFNNPYLPQTRSEMALPLIARGIITGVLDVQSIKPAAFSEDDLTTLQILADQVALAIDNTRLIVEMNQTLQELRNLYELRVGEAWQKSLGNRKITYIYNRYGVRGLENDESIHPILDEDHGALKVPIIFRGQPLGSVILRKDGEQPPWSHEEMQVVNTIVAQFSLALENARLLEETQRRAERERQIGEITAKIRSSNDPEVILRTAAAELRNALQVKHCQILLTPSRVVEDEKLVAGNGHHKPTNDTAYAQDMDTLQTEQSTQEKK